MTDSQRDYALAPPLDGTPDSNVTIDTLDELIHTTACGTDGRHDPLHELFRSLVNRCVSVVVKVPHVDMEARATIFNEGYQTAMAQQLADDPGAAQDWLTEHDATVRENTLREVIGR